MSTLSEKLQERSRADQEAVSLQTEQLLQLHAQSLQALSSAALGTTRAVIDRHSNELAAVFKTAIDNEKTHLVDLGKARAKLLHGLSWVVTWPLLASLLLSLMLVGGASFWSWRLVHQAEQEVVELNSRIRQTTDAFCKTPAGRSGCATK